MPNETTNTSDFSSVNVLVVDDEEFAQRFVTRIPKMLGSGEVLTPDNGADGT